MRWAYTGIVRPMITYGAIVWAKAADKYRTKLTRLQRLAMMSTAHFRRSTPTAGLEVMGNLMPLDIYVKGLAVRTAIRIRDRNKTIWDGLANKKGEKGHIKWAQTTMNLTETTNLDTQPVIFNWETKYLVDQ